MKLNKILLSITMLAAMTCFAQETNRTRIEFEKTLSVSVPDGFLVDSEKNSVGFKYQILYMTGDFQLEINVLKESNPTKLVNNYRMESNDSEKVEIDKFVARRLISNQGILKSNTIIIGTEKYYYLFRIYTEQENDVRLLTFLNSVKLNGKAVFPQKVEQTKDTDKLITDSELKTSPEILGALNRKADESKEYIKIDTFDELLKTSTPNSVKQTYSRQLLLLREKELYIEMSKLQYDRKTKGEMFFSLELLESGEIGQIKVFSTVDDKTIRMFVNLYRKMKFVPAQIDGKNITSNLVRVQMLNAKDPSIIQ
jgi:hypothetical protein